MDINKKVKSYEENMINDIKRLVSIKSVEEEPKEGMPFGEGPAKALNEALKIAEELGFKTKNLDNYCGYAEVGEGEELIGILGHVDVVPEGDGWDNDPYTPVIKDGVIYARGANDDKGPVIASLYAVKVLMDMGTKLNKRIRVIFGANEETGFRCMEHYKEVEEDLTMGFSPDAAFPVIFGEKGICQINIKGKYEDDKKIKIIELKGGEAANVVIPKMIVTLEKNSDIDIETKFMEYIKEHKLTGEVLENKDNKITLRLNAVSAHASTPWEGKNAGSYLMEFLGSVMKDNTLVNNYNDLIGKGYLGENSGLKMEDEYGPLTFNTGVMEAKDGELKLTIDIRYPLTEDFEKVFNILKKSFSETGYEFEVIEHKAPLYVEPDSPLVKTLQSAYEEVTGDSKNKPYTLGGGTYARAFDNVVAFGALLPDDDENAHQSNETFKVSTLLTATEVYVNALEKLLKL